MEYTKEARKLSVREQKGVAIAKLQGYVERTDEHVYKVKSKMRSLKKINTPILKGCQIFHNYFREHEGLENKTPAEVTGIKIDGQNKWITVIQNAAKPRGNNTL
jgi:hypothetical protein